MKGIFVILTLIILTSSINAQILECRAPENIKLGVQLAKNKFLELRSKDGIIYKKAGYNKKYNYTVFVASTDLGIEKLSLYNNSVHVDGIETFKAYLAIVFKNGMESELEILCYDIKQMNDKRVREGLRPSPIEVEEFEYEKKTDFSTIGYLESMALLKIFAKDESITHTMYSWATGAENTSPIKWLHAGTKETSRDDKHSYQRQGIIHLLNDGEITHQVLKESLEDGIWKVTLKGARGGYFIVDINSGVFMEPPPRLHIDEKYIIKQKHCNQYASSYTSMYLIKFDKKKAFWLEEHFSSGSAGGSHWYTITYDKQPECKM